MLKSLRKRAFYLSLLIIFEIWTIDRVFLYTHAMSQLLIHNYIREIESLIQYGGDKKETSIRRAFANLLTAYCKPHDLLLVDELEYITKLNTRVVPDGTIKDALRLTHGYWEAKDERDIIDDEIALKFKKGYPSDNILFEDSKTRYSFKTGLKPCAATCASLKNLTILLSSLSSLSVLNFKVFAKPLPSLKKTCQQYWVRCVS